MACEICLKETKERTVFKGKCLCNTCLGANYPEWVYNEKQLRDKLISKREGEINYLKQQVETLKDVLSKKQNVIYKLGQHPLLKDISNKIMEEYLNA